MIAINLQKEWGFQYSKEIIMQKMKITNVVWVLALAAILVLAACAQPTAAPTLVPSTNTPEPLPTAVPSTPTPTPIPPIVEPPVFDGAPVAVLPTPMAGQPTATANTNTWIYSGPGTNYVVYAAMNGGTPALVVGVDSTKQWFVISVPVAPNGIGWVAGSAVTVTNTGELPVYTAPPPPPSVAMVPPGPNDPQATALVETMVRSGPGNTYPAFGFAQSGKTALVLGKSADAQWWMVRIDPSKVGAGNGWVAAAFVSTANTDSVPVVQVTGSGSLPPSMVVPPAPVPGAPLITTTEYVNLRSGPGTNYPVIGNAAPGASTTPTGISADGAWFQFAVPTSFYPAGFLWVSSSFVVAINTSNLPVVNAPPPPAAVTTPPSSSTTTGDCALVSQTPTDGGSFNPGTPFSVTWVLKNTGKNVWMAGEADIVFQGAINNVRLSQGYDVFDIPNTVNPGQTLSVTGNGIAPSSSGSYGELWAIIQNTSDQQVNCPFWFTMIVP
jgi:uncharacterized protein YraI